MKRLLFCSIFILVGSIGVLSAAEDWIMKSSGTIEDLQAINFVDQQNGWLVGTSGTVLKTIDSGETWSAVNLTNEDLKGVSFFDTMLGLIVGDNGIIFRTTNGGIDWSPVSSGTDANLAGVSFGVDGYAYVAGRDGVILRSIDSGASWAALAAGTERYRSVFAIGSTYAWVVGNDGVVKATTDGGANWSSQSTGSISDLHDVFFLDALMGWAVGQNDVAYKTTDGGANWVLKNSGVNVGLESVACINGLFGVAVGNSGLTFDTMDGGASWMPQQSPVSSELNDLFLASPSLAWAVGNGGVILKRGTTSAAETVMLANHDALGSILTDSAGNTLYFFTKDAFDASVCEGGCKTNWPIFYNDDLQIGAGLDAADFSTILRADGDMQTAYKGWPLYYFINDHAAGETNGEDVGGVWYVAKPDYSIMLVDNQLVGADGINYNGSYEPGDEVVQYFVDDYGRTLYGFLPDEYNKNNYTEPDFSNDPIWPIYETINKTAPSVLDSSLFSVIDVHGRQQLTYKGWPLYYFGPDSMQRGLNKGVSVPSPGVWPIIQKDMPPAQTKVVVAENGSLGTVLTDGSGNVLYFFTKDAFDASVCAGGCKTNWPIFYGENLNPGNGLESSDFASITRADGDMQTTFKGWPLYYFINDNAPGDVSGEDVGGVWYVAKPNYSVMLVDNQLVGADGVNYTSTYEAGDEVVQYFVDDYGRTLYIFINDTFEKNNFTNEDFSNDPVWPIYETENITVPSVLAAGLFSIIDVFGHKQLCYQGWPLYYFGQDNMMRGINKGVSVPRPGVWPVAQTTLGVATGVENAENELLPTTYELSQNYPNPFNPNTTISFSLPKSSNVALTIYNVLGKAVRTFSNTKLEAGVHQLVWNAIDDNGQPQSSGLYYYTLKSGDFSSTKRMLLLK
jgi:predicted lipoprotein with Yx(FWY)xxD motif/photosystem II stability/assembly factor-like uncharacterized protein